MQTKKKLTDYLLLHLSVFLFSLTGVFSKLAANSMENGIQLKTLLFLALMVLNCGVYALFWQQNLKKFEMHTAYAHKTVYNIWSICWAGFLFHENVTVGNILGALLIIAGVVVIQNE